MKRRAGLYSGAVPGSVRVKHCVPDLQEVRNHFGRRRLTG